MEINKRFVNMKNKYLVISNLSEIFLSGKFLTMKDIFGRK